MLLLEGLTWNYPLIIILITIIFLYFYALKRYTTIHPFSKQPLLFLLSMFLLYAIIGSPLSTFSHLSFSLHMIQMSILYFIIPPFILASIPVLRHNFRWITKLLLPVKVSLVLFSCLFLIYHLPVAMELFTQYPLIQQGISFFLFILSFSLWWPLLSPIPGQRLSKVKKKRYLFLSGILLMPACTIFILNAFIDGAQHPFLNQLSAQLCIPPEAMVLNGFSPFSNTTYDQVLAGSLMLGIHKIGMAVSNRLGQDDYSDI